MLTLKFWFDIKISKLYNCLKYHYKYKDQDKKRSLTFLKRWNHLVRGFKICMAGISPVSRFSEVLVCQ